MIDRAAALALPGATDEAGDAVAGDRPALMPADGEDEMPRAERGDSAGRRRRQAVRREAQHGDVSARIAPGERGRDAPPVGQGDGDVVVALERLFGGNEDARAPMDGAGRAAPAAMDGDDAARGGLDERGEAVGIERESIGGRVGHAAAPEAIMTAIWSDAPDAAIGRMAREALPAAAKRDVVADGKKRYGPFFGTGLDLACGGGLASTR